MAVKSISQNKYILRRYIRLLSQYPGMEGHKDAISYFIILHNFLELEDMFYDQCTMANKNINIHLTLLSDVKMCSTAVQIGKLLYSPNHKVRFGIETLDSIEDVRVFMATDECKRRDIYNKLVHYFKSARIV